MICCIKSCLKKKTVVGKQGRGGDYLSFNVHYGYKLLIRNLRLNASGFCSQALQALENVYHRIHPRCWIGHFNSNLCTLHIYNSTSCQFLFNFTISPLQNPLVCLQLLNSLCCHLHNRVLILLQIKITQEKTWVT